MKYLVKSIYTPELMKEVDFMIGIYKITNMINNKCYIGQSIHIEQRLEDHKRNYQSNVHLQNSISKYGINNFKFEVIEECIEGRLNEREIYWIEYYDSTNRDKGYNISIGGQGGYLLKNASDELKNRTYKKISESKYGVKRGHNSEETNIKIGISRKRYLDTHVDAKNNLIIHLNKVRPKHLSEEAKIKLSKAMSGDKNPFYGKKHSEESRKRISESVKKAYADGKFDNVNRSHSMSIESRNKLSNSLKGNTNSKNKMNGRILINNGSVSKQINPEELQNYLDNGWVKGRIGKPKSNGRAGKIRINNGEVSKFILPEELSKYESEGWFRK